MTELYGLSDRRAAQYNQPMQSTLEEGLRILAEATELAKSIRIDLTDDYLRRIASSSAVQ